MRRKEVNLILIKKIISRRLILILSILAILMIAGLYYFIFPKHEILFPKCPFFVLTHLYCPGCGSQRCIADLVHGRFLAALHQNILAILALPIIFYRLYLIYKKRTTINTIFVTRSMPWIVLIVVVLFGVFRNIPISPFNWLAPY